MNSQEIRLILQVALLGEVGAALRAVEYGEEQDRLLIRFYFDGEISADDRESASCVVTEVIAALPEHVSVSEELSRCDAPARLPNALRRVFQRRE